MGGVDIMVMMRTIMMMVRVILFNSLSSVLRTSFLDVSFTDL